jgi:hypothetical protein
VEQATQHQETEDSRTSEASDFVRTALEYVARGLCVLPLHSVTEAGRCTCGASECISPGKHPIASLAPRGLKDGTTDPKTVRAWATTWTGAANIGIVTGTGSGIFVLDVDDHGKGGPDNLEKLEAEHGRLPDTVQSITGGGGFHLFYRHPGGRIPSRNDALGPGLDIKGDGGYVVAPGSRHVSGQPYEWASGMAPGQIEIADASAWVLEQVAAKVSPDVPNSTEVPETGRALTSEDIEGIRSRMRAYADRTGEAGESGKARAIRNLVDGKMPALPPHLRPAGDLGRYSAWLCSTQALATCSDAWMSTEALLNEFVRPAWREEVAAARDGKHKPLRLVERMLRTARPKSAAKAAAEKELFGSFASGPPAPAETTGTKASEPENPFARALAQAKADMAARGFSSGARAERDSSPFASLGELELQDFPDADWLVKDLLVGQSVQVIAGEPKSSKTWCSQELGLALATGSKAFGQFEARRQGHVAFFMAEDSAKDARKRMRALAHYRNLTDEQRDRIHIACRKSLNLLDHEDVAWIIASCRTLPEAPVVLFLDPFRDIHRANEDSSNEMAPVMAALRLLRDLIGCSVVFIHHSRKVSRDSAEGIRPGQLMRGSGAIHGAVDGGMYLTEPGSPDGESIFESMVQVELKAYRGAGRFYLALHIQDDAEGQAHIAGWRYARARPDKSPITASSRAEKVSNVLRETYPAGLSLRGIQDRMRGQGANFYKVREALEELQAAGRVRRSQKRGGAGVMVETELWEHVPSQAELDERNGVKRDSNAPAYLRALAEEGEE